VASPEETRANLAACAAAGAVEALVFQRTPLFIAQTPPCPTGGGASGTAAVFTDRRGKTLRSALLDGMWITTEDAPFACAGEIADLSALGIGRFRCDWSWRTEPSAAVAAAWRAVREGASPPGSHDANFSRGLR